MDRYERLQREAEALAAAYRFLGYEDIAKYYDGFAATVFLLAIASNLDTVKLINNAGDAFRDAIRKAMEEAEE